MKKLPCPRLELRWTKHHNPKEETGGESGWYHRQCVYSLVIPLRDLDLRRENSEGKQVRKELKLVIRTTNVSGGVSYLPPIHEGVVDTPFRDGAHIQWDHAALGYNIPMVAVCGKKFTIIKRNNSVA